MNSRFVIDDHRVAQPQNPMVGTLAGCCARAASGHTAAPPPARLRRFSRRSCWSSLEPSNSCCCYGNGRRARLRASASDMILMGGGLCPGSRYGACRAHRCQSASRGRDLPVASRLNQRRCALDSWVTASRSTSRYSPNQSGMCRSPVSGWRARCGRSTGCKTNRTKRNQSDRHPGTGLAWHR